MTQRLFESSGRLEMGLKLCRFYQEGVMVAGLSRDWSQ